MNWKIWFKFVGLLIIILGIWLGLLFLGNHFLGETFERNKVIHYLILLIMVIKAKGWFISKINNDSETDVN